MQKNTVSKVLSILTLGSALVAGRSSAANQLSFVPPWGPNGGGEFIVNSSTTLGSFHTFCLEYDEHLWIPGTADYTINSKAMGGGPGYTPNGDPLSIGTAWLYSRFALGNLASDFGYVSAVDQGQLQKAIWWLEEESNSPDYGIGAANHWVQLAKSELGLTLDSEVRANGNGAYGVVALNLDPVGPSTARMQDVLAKVPDSGLTLGLLGTGIALLAVARRRL